MPILAVYGTLKRGMYNHYRMKDAKYLGDIELKGFKMYAQIPMSFYPAAVKSDNPNDTISGEIFRISDDAYESIERMELNSGYYVDKINMLIEKEYPLIFLMKQEMVDKSLWTRVKSGVFDGFSLKLK